MMNYYDSECDTVTPTSCYSNQLPIFTLYSSRVRMVVESVTRTIPQLADWPREPSGDEDDVTTGEGRRSDVASNGGNGDNGNIVDWTGVLYGTALPQGLGPTRIGAVPRWHLHGLHAIATSEHWR